MTQDNAEWNIAKILSDPEIKGTKWDQKARELGLRPGQLVPGTQQWVPWRVGDLNPNDTVQFVPQYVTSIAYNGLISERGNPILMVDVNNLKAMYEVGVPTITNRFFYNVYVNALDNAIALEELKRHGPKWGPHSNGGYDGSNTWYYRPEAPSFGVDVDGRFLRPGGYYELDQDNIPVALKGRKLLAALYFKGVLDLTVTKEELLGLIFTVFKARIKGKINRFISKFKRGKK